jgi:putative protease
MKIAVTPFNISSITELAKAGADIFIAGNEEYANRLVYSFSSIELKEVRELTKSLGKEMYLNMNLIVHQEHIEQYKTMLEFAKDLGVDGIIFGDIGVYMMARDLGIEANLIYNPETLNANYYDTSFWKKKGIKGLTLAKEITYKDIVDICQRKEVEVSIIGHGHLNMFHSRRPLIENFFKFTRQEYKDYVQNRDLKLVEEIRNESYPIFQDMHGTHIFREKALESYKEILGMEACLDVFIIDGIFKDTKYLIEVVSNYRSILKTKDMDLAKNLSQSVSQDHDSGFLHKKTQYDKVGE